MSLILQAITAEPLCVLLLLSSPVCPRCNSHTSTSTGANMGEARRREQVEGGRDGFPHGPSKVRLVRLLGSRRSSADRDGLPFHHQLSRTRRYVPNELEA